jgi:Cdc6-like AAA superfamily ATPase
MSNSPSPLENIHDAIKNSNPFSIKFVDQHHIWGASFPDVPEINAHISDAVFHAIDQVSKNELPSIGIIITGEKGLGKTQVISRIRHRLQSEGNTFFVYMGNYGDLDCIKSEFLQTLTSSLKRIGIEGVTQWQELAANMFFTARGNRPCSPKDLANGKFAAIVRNKPKTPEGWANTICSRKPELNNPYLVKAILWTLSENHAPYAISWLSGQELTQAKADELGLPNNSQKNELATFKTTCELLALIGHYSNLVFCFDELDDPNCSDRGFTRAQIVAALAKDLRNSISKCVLLMAMYPATLRDEIKLGQTQGASYDRTADKVLELDYLNSDTSVTLVNKWLEDFYASKELIPPNPLYPFDESEIREIGKEKPTARAILKWCSENWKVTGTSEGKIQPVIDPIIEPVIHPVKAAFKNEFQSVEDSIDEYMENNTVVGDALWRAFKALTEENIEGVKVTDVTRIDSDDSVRSSDQGYLHFRIIAEENGKVVKIGVAAILQASGKFIGAALKRLIDYKKFGFTRGCLVRSHKINKGSPIPQECVRKLLKEQGGEWVTLLKEHIKPLIAISFVFNKAKNYDLTEEQVYGFIKETRLAINNPLVREILSDPSGQEPLGLIDDELPISIPRRDSDAYSEEIAL